MATQQRIVYMCEVCLAASDTPIMHHGRLMVKCDAGCAGDDCTKPVTDEAGHILSHAPKWWIRRHQRAHTEYPH